MAVEKYENKNINVINSSMLSSFKFVINITFKNSFTINKHAITSDMIEKVFIFLSFKNVIHRHQCLLA